jgi:hypothetical protein
MRKVILSVCLCILTVGLVSAQDISSKWYIGTKAGTNLFVAEGNRIFGSDNSFSLKRNTGMQFSLLGGLECNSLWGFRGELCWANTQWYRPEESQLEMNNLDFVADATLNWVNLFWGEKPERKIDAIAFAGLGLAYRMKADFPDALLRPMMQGGLEGRLHIDKHWIVTLSGSIDLLNDRTNDFVGGIPVDIDFPISLGCNYHF